MTTLRVIWSITLAIPMFPLFLFLWIATGDWRAFHEMMWSEI